MVSRLKDDLDASAILAMHNAHQLRIARTIIDAHVKTCTVHNCGTCRVAKEWLARNGNGDSVQD
jgi:hypothetical protein